MFNAQPGAGQSIFVSSTFRDMHAERDALRDYVLPRVNEFAGRYGRQVELVDLRWGIDTAGIDEQEQNQKVLHTCLEEIERSRPFFIGILGDRYGWVVPESTLDDALGQLEVEIDRTEKAVTELEIEYGALRAAGEPLCLFYFRSLAHAGAGLPAVYGDDETGTRRLQMLKERIRDRFGAGVKEYTARLEGEEVTGLQAFCDMLAEDIVFALEQAWGPAPDGEKSRYLQESEAQAAFYAYHIEGFAGRADYIGRLSAACRAAGEASAPVRVVTGAAGAGKSALLSALARDLSEKGCLALPFYCGITGRSSTLEDMLLYYINGVNAYLGYNEESGGGLDFVARKELLATLLAEAAAKTRVVLLADSLDALRQSRLLDESLWLEDLLPAAGACVVLSCAPGYAGLLSLGRLGAAVEEIEALTAGDIAAVLQSQARALHKELTPAVVAHICEKRDETGALAAENPLYLRLLVQNFVMMDRHGHARIEAYSAQGMPAIDAIARVMTELVDEMPPRPEAAYVAVFNRLEGVIGREFVLTALSLIAASRYGLREDVLGEAFAEMGHAYNTADFAWLRNLFGKQFIQGEYGQWNFMHQSMRRAVSVYQPGLVARGNGALVPVMRKRLALNQYAAEEILHHLYKANQPALAAEVLSGDIRYYQEQGLPANAFSILASRPKAMQFGLRGFSPQLVGIITAEENAGAYAATLADIFSGGEAGRAFVLAVPKSGGADPEYISILANLYYDALMGALPADVGAAGRLALLEATLAGLADSLDAELMNRRLYAEICAKAAQYAQQLGEEEKAAHYLHKGLDESRLIYAESGDIDDEWQITTWQNRLGDLAADAGDYEAALGHFRQALARREGIAEVEPERDLSASCLRLGEVLGKLGDAGALDYLHKGFDARRARADALGTDESRRAFGVAASRLSAYYEESGDAAKAFEYAQTAQNTFRRAYQAEGRIEYLRHAASALLDMARNAGEGAGAAEIPGYYEKAIEDYAYITERQGPHPAAGELAYAQMQACLHYLDLAEAESAGAPAARYANATRMLDAFLGVIGQFGLGAAGLSTLRAAAGATGFLEEAGALAHAAPYLEKAIDMLDYVCQKTGDGDTLEQRNKLKERL